MDKFIRLPGHRKENPSITFYLININDIKYIRGWTEGKGSATTYGSAVYFKNGFDVKIDVPEPQLSKMLINEGVEIIGYNEL